MYSVLMHFKAARTPSYPFSHAKVRSSRTQMPCYQPCKRSSQRIVFCFRWTVYLHLNWKLTTFPVYRFDVTVINCFSNTSSVFSSFFHQPNYSNWIVWPVSADTVLVQLQHTYPTTVALKLLHSSSAYSPV